MLPAVLAAAIVVGLVAAGIVLAQGGASSGVVKGHPAVLAKGSFRSVGWGAQGTATVSRDASGRLHLRFSKDFLTQRAPALFVYMVKYRDKERTLWYQVAALKHAWGAQQYTLPSKRDPPARRVGGDLLREVQQDQRPGPARRASPVCLGAPSEMPPAGFEPALRP